MLLADRLTLDAPRRSQDGYLLVHAKAARAGVYDYLGAEVDPTGSKFRAADVVKVYRPESEVFDKASLASFVLRPITDDHPTVPVTAANWRDHAGGSILGAAKDGEHVGFDLAFMDAATVAKVDAGKVELSAGYSCDVAFEDGEAPDGTAYQAVQRNIRGNHVALVARGRAGPTCRVVADAATCGTLPSSLFDNLKTEKPVKKILLDGLTVDIADADTAEATIRKLEGERNQARDAKATAETTLAAKDTEIATLKTENQQLKDSKPTPAQLRDAARSFAVVCDKAKAVGVEVTDTMDEPAIMKAVVTKVMGDAAKDWNEAQIAASFAVATKDAKPATATVQPIHAPQVIGDAAVVTEDAAYRRMVDRLTGKKTA